MANDAFDESTVAEKENNSKNEEVPSTVASEAATRETDGNLPGHDS